MNDASPSFLFHVFREGRLLLSRDEAGLADRMEPLLRRAAIEAFGA